RRQRERGEHARGARENCRFHGYISGALLAAVGVRRTSPALPACVMLIVPSGFRVATRKASLLVATVAAIAPLGSVRRYRLPWCGPAMRAMSFFSASARARISAAVGMRGLPSWSTKYMLAGSPDPDAAACASRSGAGGIGAAAPAGECACHATPAA